MFPFLCTPILAIHLLAQRPFKESNACSKRPLSADGTAVAFGAIIRSDPESSGGARGAACRTLSHYGMAIKISTDGYVEMYLDREKVMEIK